MAEIRFSNVQTGHLFFSIFFQCVFWHKQLCYSVIYVEFNWFSVVLLLFHVFHGNVANTNFDHYTNGSKCGQLKFTQKLFLNSEIVKTMEYRGNSR